MISKKFSPAFDKSWAFILSFMKVFRFFFVFVGVVIMLGSCSQENTAFPIDGDVKTFLNIQSVPLQSSENVQDSSDVNDNKAISRSIAIGKGNSYQIGFVNGDAFGVFPQGGHQVDFPFTIPDGQVVTNSSIVATGWRTKGGVKYVAYEPFDYENRDASHINWDFRKIQQQSGNNTRDHLGKYWFLASDTISPTIDPKGNSIFNALVYDMGAVLRFQCYVPVKADYVRAMFVAPDAVFATHGYYDLFDTEAPKVDLGKTKSINIPNPMKHQPFHAEGYTDHVTVDIQSAPLDANGILSGYIAVPEVDLRGKTVTLYIWDADGNLYVGNKALTSTQGYLSRGAITNVLFKSMSPATTLNVKINDWEKSELCDDCKPVAF